MSLDLLDPLRALMRIRVVSRSLDLLASHGFLLLALPWMMLIALAVRLEVGSPVLYKQLRIGLDGRTYYAFKFRTTRTDGYGNPQITRAGAVIRRLGFDELPQIFNVLHGNWRESPSRRPGL